MRSTSTGTTAVLRSICPDSRKTRAGFTLIEALVALALLLAQRSHHQQRCPWAWKTTVARRYTKQGAAAFAGEIPRGGKVLGLGDFAAASRASIDTTSCSYSCPSALCWLVYTCFSGYLLLATGSKPGLAW